MSSNGRLSDGELSAIYGGRLERHAAAAWNALCIEARARYGIQLAPVSSRGAYRTYTEQQYFWDLYRSGRGNLAAYPGTSNHGWGLAVDLGSQRMRWVVDQIGAKYGWAKRWSDAPSEWWHIRYRPGVWHGHAPWPVLRYGSRGPKVRWVQRRLRAHGYTSVKVRGYYGSATVRAVRKFQKAKNLRPVDGKVGPQTKRHLAR